MPLGEEETDGDPETRKNKKWKSHGAARRSSRLLKFHMSHAVGA